MKSCCLSDVNTSSSHKPASWSTLYSPSYWTCSSASLLAATGVGIDVVLTRTHEATWRRKKKKRQCRAQINLKRVRGDGQVNRASGCHTSLYFCQTPTESQRCKVRTVCCESVTQRRDGNIPCEKWNFIFLLLSRNISQYIITKLIC